CCHPYVSGEKVAPDPEHLMRSRYCAFVMKDADYLIKTWHPSCGAAALRAELIAGFAHTEWLGLTVFFQKSRTFNDCTCFATFGKSRNKTDKSD
ncbi:YchJ family metal-binding protein, partial [Escherichia coli]|uniref:YchJ family metal-binding protein n=1 Tax=Escherichia coli TaxID=562 RepID=UPI0024536BBA